LTGEDVLYGLLSVKDSCSHVRCPTAISHDWSSIDRGQCEWSVGRTVWAVVDWLQYSKVHSFSLSDIVSCYIHITICPSLAIETTISTLAMRIKTYTVQQSGISRNGSVPTL
jgi:hypothetical protein